jgi:cell division transport system permease protein
MRGSNFRYLFRQGIASVWQNRLMSFASFCILMVSLLLIGLSVLVSLDVGIIIGNIENNNEIYVFVYNETPQSELSYISDILRNFDRDGRIRFVPKEEAWEMMKERMGEERNPLFETENIMPSTFIVTLSDITRINEAAERFARIENVEDVIAPHDFAEFLISIRNTFTIIGIAVMLALIIVCLVIIYNTARTSVFARRMQISIMKHVGATNAFIKFPFFIEGMFIGVIAGVASWFLTKVAYESVVSLFTGDVMILEILGLGNLIGFNDINWYVLAANCLVGALLGAIGTVLSMGKHLKV